MFDVCLCVHFQTNPKDSPLYAFKCIMTYLTNISLKGLWYHKGTNFKLVALILISLVINWIGIVLVVCVTYLGTDLSPSIEKK